MANEPVKPYHRFVKSVEEYVLDSSLHLWSRVFLGSSGYSPWIFRKCYTLLSPDAAIQQIQKAAIILDYEDKGVVEDGHGNG